jgi:hypothetical protein
MKSGKILIGVLFLIIIVFAIGIGMGARHDPNEKPDLNSGPLVFLQQMFAEPQPLASDDISSASPTACLQGERLLVPLSGTCRFSIQSSGAMVRRITFDIPPGTVLAVTLDQPNALKVTQNLPADASEHLDVYKDGGILQITCAASLTSTCLSGLK